MKHCLLAILVGFILGTPFLFAQTNAPAASPRDQLQQLTTQLQKSPDDRALREKIIALARTLVPAPALPDEAERRMARGTEAFKEAKSPDNYRDAVKEFQQATLAAPWSGDAYFNLGLAQDKAEDFEGSLGSLKLAQLASPDSKDVKDLYYKVEYQRDKAAEQDSAAANKAAQLAAFYQGLDGGIWRLDKEYLSVNSAPENLYFDHSNMGQRPMDTFMEIHGNEIKKYQFYDNPRAKAVFRIQPDLLNTRQESWTTTFESRQVSVDLELLKKVHGAGLKSYALTISEDGQSMTEETTIYFNGAGDYHFRGIYKRIQ